MFSNLQALNLVSTPQPNFVNAARLAVKFSPSSVMSPSLRSLPVQTLRTWQFFPFPFWFQQVSSFECSITKHNGNSSKRVGTKPSSQFHAQGLQDGTTNSHRSALHRKSSLSSSSIVPLVLLNEIVTDLLTKDFLEQKQKVLVRLRIFLFGSFLPNRVILSDFVLVTDYSYRQVSLIIHRFFQCSLRNEDLAD